METRRGLTGLVRTALATFGLAHVLVGLGMVALAIGSTWDAHRFVAVLLGAAGAAAVFLGIVLLRPARHGLAVIQVARAYAVLLLLTGILFVTLQIVSEGGLESAATGISWILAASVALVVLRKASVAPETLASTGLVATSLVLVGLAMAEPIHLVPFQPWEAIGRFHTGIDVFGGVALVLGAVAGTAAVSLPDRLRKIVPGLVAVAATLYAVATLRAALRFLADFDWGFLRASSDLFEDSALVGAATVLVLAGFLAWATASVIAFLAAAQILMHGAAKIPWPKRF